MRATKGKTHDEIDLTMSAWQDHSAVSVDFTADVNEDVKSAGVNGMPFNKEMVFDRHCAKSFEDRMWQARWAITPEASIDEQVASLEKFVMSAAVECFGAAKDRPKQPWISMTTWCTLRAVGPRRRASFEHAAREHDALLEMAWFAWRSLRPEVFLAENVSDMG